MKSPKELSSKLCRQWEYADNRENRLLDQNNAWPVVLSIGSPSANMILNQLDDVKQHVEQWRKVKVGHVVWEPKNYRATAVAVDIPTQWIINDANEWIDAANNQSVRNEYDTLAFFTAQTDCMFHSLLIRNRSLWRKKDKNQVVQATRLAMTLEPGYADGKPLRLLPTQGIDTKFFERHTQLVTALLDVRYDGEVSKIGLETFLGALTNSDHWLLVMDLDNTLLPFQKQRVRSSELRTIGLPCDRLLIVENESCQHQIPLLPHTIAVLGTGFDLGWTDGHWLQHKQVGYWGDIDTWGLHLLATARNKIKHLDALLMTNDIYNRYVSMAVPEPVTAGSQIPNGLNENEQLLYSRLLKTLNGRLEQEFLPEPVIRDAILAWGKRQFVTIRDLYHQ